MAVTTLAEAVNQNMAVMSYGGNISPVGGFCLLAVTTLAEAVKPKYVGNFLAVSGFSFLAVT